MGKVKSLIVHIVFSHVGLCIIVFAYAIGGAYLFIAIERPDEVARLEKRIQVANDIEAYRQAIVYKTYAEKTNTGSYNPSDPTPPWNKYGSWLDAYHATVDQAIDAYGYDGSVPDKDTYTYKWAFESAFLFTMTILTTIGYGHIYPKTSFGQIMVIFYALIAIPLMTMFLSNVSAALIHILTMSYEKGCCHWLLKKREKTLEKSHEMYGVPDNNAGLTTRTNVSDLPEEDPHRAATELRFENCSPTPSVAERLEPLDLEEYDGPFPDEGIETPRPVLVDPEVVEEPPPEKHQEDPVPASLSLFIIVMYLIFGTILYHFTEDWPVVTSGYFCVVSLLTIGFGDFYPGLGKTGLKAKVQMGASTVYVLLGLVVLAVAMGMIQTAIKAHAKKMADMVHQRTGLAMHAEHDGEPIKPKPKSIMPETKLPDEKPVKPLTAMTTVTTSGVDARMPSDIY